MKIKRQIEKPILCTKIVRMTGKRAVQLGHRYWRCGYLILWPYLTPPPPTPSPITHSVSTQENVSRNFGLPKHGLET